MNSPKTPERADPPQGQAVRQLGPINSRLPISPQIYELLRRAITTLAMLPSESLSEQELAAQLGVSRTPVREALIRLADDGLIDILPQRGSFVAPIRLKEVEEAQFIREALEVAVVRRIAGHVGADFIDFGRDNLARQERAVKNVDRDSFLELDEAFHKNFCEAAGLPRSWRAIQVVKLQIDRVRYLSLPERGRLEVVLAQHKAIFAAVIDGPPDAAAAEMSRHLREVLRTVQTLNVQRPDLFRT
jgi:GntR family transcriptional regulator, rspAB operon transcriptional repressor